MSAKFFIYLITTPLVIYSLDSININQIFKKNKVKILLGLCKGKKNFDKRETIKERDLKRMLAYSSVAQVGYIYLGIGLGTTVGIASGKVTSEIFLTLL